MTEVADEQAHALFLANKIVALGVEPVTESKPVPKARNNREMLEALFAAEVQAGKDYTQRAKEAEEYGDKGMAVQLEDMVRETPRRASECSETGRRKSNSLRR